MEQQAAFIVGISGCSSSGKTTVARLLRDIFPNSFILHEDDFYKPEDELPRKAGFVDWDCIDALSIPGLEKALLHIRTCGFLPPDLDSKEDRNSVGKCPIADEEIAAEKAKVQKWLKEGSSGFRILEETGRKLCFVDGFLLYGSVLGTVMKLLDLKLFLLASRTKLIERREARDGYVTLEGFWKDPPGYIEKVVWPNYAEAHSWLFRNGEVEGELDLHVLDKANIQAQTGHGLDSPLNVSLSWAVDQVIAALEAAYPVSKLEETS